MLNGTLQSLLSTLSFVDPNISPWFIWVPTALGVGMVIYCLARRATLPVEMQKFAWGGLKLEISVFTSMILFGVLLSLAGVGIYVFTSIRQISKLEQDIIDAKNKREAAEQAAQNAQHLTLFLQLKQIGRAHV